MLQELLVAFAHLKASKAGQRHGTVVVVSAYAPQ